MIRRKLRIGVRLKPKGPVVDKLRQASLSCSFEPDRQDLQIHFPISTGGRSKDQRFCCLKFVLAALLIPEELLAVRSAPASLLDVAFIDLCSESLVIRD